MKSKLKFLFVAIETPEFRDLISFLKSKGLDFTFESVDRKPLLKKSFNQQPWDVLLIDDSVPALRIEDALKMAASAIPAIPRIVLLEELTEEIAVKCMNNGASDLVRKSNHTRLIPSIHNALYQTAEKSLMVKGQLFEKYDYIFNSSKSFLSLVDRKYTYQAINNALRNAHNLEKNKILGKNLASIWGRKKFTEFIKPNLDKCFNGEEIHYKAWFETPTIGLRYYEVSFSPYKEQDDEVSHVIVETKDITKEKELEEKIVQTETEVISIIENTNDYFWSVDKDYNVLYTNKLFQTAFNAFYHTWIVPGSNIISLLPDNEKPLWKKWYNRGFKGEHFTFEQSYLLEGKMVYYEVTINPILNKNKEITGLSCMSVDVTERKMNENRIRVQSEDLGLLNILNNAVNEGMDMVKIMTVLARETKRMFGGMGAGIYLISAESKKLHPVTMPLGPKMKSELEKLSGIRLNKLSINIEGNGHYANTLKGGIPVLSDTPSKIQSVCEDFIKPEFQRKNIVSLGMKILNLKSILSIPLISEGTPLGVMDMSTSTFFTEYEIERLTQIARQITSILKRKLTEASILESELRFRHLFESANDAIFILQDNLFVECNEKTLELFRCEKKDILGKSPIELSPEFQPNGEKSVPLARKKLALAAKGHPVRFDWVHSRPDKSTFYSDVSLNQLLTGNEAYIQAIVRDITIRKESESLLKESEERFRAIFEDAADPIFLADPESGYILDANSAACSLIQKPKEEIIGNHQSMLYPPEQSGTVGHDFKTRKSGPGTQAVEVVYLLRTDGKRIPVEIHSRLIHISGKKVVQGAFRDISERFEAQKELMQKEKSLRETQRIARLGSWRISLKTRKVQWSDETFSILGYDASKTKPAYENWKARVHPEDWPEVSDLFDNALMNKTDYESEFRIIRPDGQIRNLYSKAEMTYDTNKDSYELIGFIHDLTEIRQVEMALRESEEKFRTLFYEGYFPMVLGNPQKPNSKQPNKAFLNLMGYTEAELQNISLIELTHPADRELTLKVFDDLVNGRVETVQIEKRYIKKDGGIIWGQTGAGVIKDESGTVRNIIVMIIDITREKLAEQQIKERTIDLTLINDLNLQANANKSLERILIFFSGQIWSLFRKASFRLMIWEEDKNLFSFHHIKPPEQVRDEISSILGRILSGHVFKPAKNSSFWKRFIKKEPWLITHPEEIQSHLSQIMDKADNPGATLEVMEIVEIRSLLSFPLVIGNEILGNALLVCPEQLDDKIVSRLSNIMEQFTGILKRKLVEEEETKLYTVIEQIKETVVITDTEGIIQYVNPGFEASSGYSRQSAVGLTPAILKSGKHDARFYKDLWDIILSGKSWSGKIINKHKNGHLYEEEVTISPVKDENGRILNFVAVKRDITKEKILEAQLQQAQKLETIGTLAGGIAHDFNNILGTLLGYNEMVLDEVPTGSNAKDYSMQMKKALNRAKTLVNQILTFSRKKDPEKKIVSIAELLTESLSMFKSVLPEHITIKTEICEDCQPIHADPAQMQQVFMNLLTNAGQALKVPGGTIDVVLEPLKNNKELKSLHPVLKSERLMKFTVSDDGPGMDEKILNRIFEPFFTTKPVGEGTGLGLSVVHGIITNHNAAIEVESTPGERTRFSVYLQVSESHR